MATIRVEYVSVAQVQAFNDGADNVISEILLADTLTVSASAAYTAAAPAKSNAARVTSIGGVAIVNNKDVASNALGVRLIDGATEFFAVKPGDKISALTGT